MEWARAAGGRFEEKQRLGANWGSILAPKIGHFEERVGERSKRLLWILSSVHQRPCVVGYDLQSLKHQGNMAVRVNFVLL